MWYNDNDNDNDKRNKLLHYMHCMKECIKLIANGTLNINILQIEEYDFSIFPKIKS